jgi:hypothetical protein
MKESQPSRSRSDWTSTVDLQWEASGITYPRIMWNASKPSFNEPDSLGSSLPIYQQPEVEKAALFFFFFFFFLAACVIARAATQRTLASQVWTPVVICMREDRQRAARCKTYLVKVSVSNATVVVLYVSTLAELNEMPLEASAIRIGGEGPLYKL